MDSRITEAFWSKNYFSREFNRAEWQAHPYSIERQFDLQGGKSRERWFADNYLGNAPIGRALGIGVGRAETEVELIRIGAVLHYDLWDVSVDGLEYARDILRSDGLEDRVSLNHGDFETSHCEYDEYGLVTFVASLHHFSTPSRVIKMARDRLSIGGILWAANEYIGPDRFDYPDEIKSLAQGFHSHIPRVLQKHGLPFIQFPTVEEVIEADPSESPSSSILIESVNHIFGACEMLSLYGALPFVLFWGLNHEALYDTVEGRSLVQFILAMDIALTNSGVFPPYFAHIVASR
jgi:SAM-dependent methyltransferase